MKKNYFFTLLLTLFISITSIGQVIITELADPNDNALARYVEIYNVSNASVDLTNWELRRWTNGAAAPQATGIDLTSIGTLAPGAFAIIAANSAEFQTVYGLVADIDAGTAGAADSNGDDQIAIFDAADNTIDIFGVPGEDGTGTCHEFEDGRAERIATVSASNPVWDESEWNVWADSQVTGCTSHTQLPINVGDNVFDPGVWIGATSGTNPTVSASPADLSGFVQFVGAPSDEQTTEVSGSNLTTDVTATVNGDYEISLTTATGFGPSVVLLQTAGELTATLLYVRLNGAAPASPSNGEIVLSSTGADDIIVPLMGEILNPDAILFSSIDTLLDFSHFVGTPSVEQSFEVSGNYLTDDLTIDVTGEYEISAASNGTFSNSLTLPSYSNATVVDASADWLGYMNVFDLPENGGGYQFGSTWGFSDLKSSVIGTALRLQPNFNTYGDNTADPYWVNQTTGAGNKNMEAITLLEPGASANDNDLTFAGTVVSNTLDLGYEAKFFIKALDPITFADVFGGSKIIDLPANGNFSVSATAAELPAGLIVQYGFMIVGPNANPADAGVLGSVVVNGEIVPGEVTSTPIYVRLNGAAQNYNQTGTATISSGGSTTPVSHTVNAGNYYYAPASLTINAGDTVYWVNEGGTHNVNFTNSTIDGNSFNNPESFISTATTDVSMYSYVFTVEGTYQYDCSVGSHALNGMTGTIIVLGSDSPESKTVALFGETLDYTPSTIADVTTNDVDGVADSLDVYVLIEGVVHCIDFDGNEGLSFAIIDLDNNGINVYNFADVSAYVVNEGDMIRILGQIDQFNGLTQVFADSILVLAADMPTVTPTVVTALNEGTESQWITLEGVNFVDPIATFPTGSNNIDVTDGINVYTLRIDSDTDIPGGAVPQGLFDVTGVGGQYDSSNPFDSGYQLFPCGLGSFVPNDVSGITEAFVELKVSPNPFQDYVSINTSGSEHVFVRILDVQGRLLESLAVNNGMKINTSAWVKGMYLFTFTDENQNIRTERMIK